MTNTLCPKQACRDINERTGSADETTPAVIIGGSTCYVPDDIAYMMSVKTLMVVRARMNGKTPKSIIRKLYAEYQGKTHADVFKMLLERSSMYKYTMQQIMRLMRVVAQLNTYICERVAQANCDTELNLSLPDIVLPEDAGVHAAQNNRLLQTVVNRLITYVNELNLTAIGVPKAELTLFQETPPAISTNTTVVDLGAMTEADLGRIHDLELEISKQVTLYEQYQLAIVNHVNGVFEWLAEAKIEMPPQ